MDWEKYFNSAKRHYIDLGFARFAWEESPAYRWMFSNPFMDILGKAVFGREEYTEGPYEIEHVELQPGDVALDVGANLGLFSALACYKGCRVIAFEPLPRNIGFLKTFQLLNPGFDFTLEECGLSNFNGDTVLYNHEHDLGGGTIIDDIRERFKAQSGRAVIPTRIRIATIDSYNFPKVDFIKADIEGAEVPMIEGAKETIKRCKPRLSLCSYHHAADPHILEYLIKSIRPDYTVIKGVSKLYAY